MAAAVFSYVCGDDALISTPAADGDQVGPGSVLVSVTGRTHDLLQAERPALNLLCHLSGIATLTRAWVDAVTGTEAAIRDTRKTTPGMRRLEKYAVRCGGGVNHRMSLSDAALVKDNHLAALGDLSLLPPVIAKLHAEHPGLPIEIEADTLEQVERLLIMPGIDVILLDNMSPELMIRAVALRAAIAPSVLLEASGGVTLESLGEIARTGVDRISVGALTHSAMNADLSLELEHVS